MTNRPGLSANTWTVILWAAFAVLGGCGLLAFIAPDQLAAFSPCNWAPALPC